MTRDIILLDKMIVFSCGRSINLFTGEGAFISHKGQLSLVPKLTLQNILCVTSFNHNLISIQSYVEIMPVRFSFYVLIVLLMIED